MITTDASAAAPSLVVPRRALPLLTDAQRGSMHPELLETGRKATVCLTAQTGKRAVDVGHADVEISTSGAEGLRGWLRGGGVWPMTSMPNGQAGDPRAVSRTMVR